jgi:hypothetical protein
MKKTIPDASFPVNSYALAISTYGTDEIINPRYRYPVINIFKDASGATGDLHAQLFFYPNGAKLPSPTYPDAGHLASLPFHFDQFDFILDLLASPGKVICSVKSEGKVVYGSLEGPTVRRQHSRRPKVRGRKR